MDLFQDAEFYNKNSSVQTSEAMSLIVSLGIDFKGKALLDVGCGDGKITDCMRLLGAKTTGIDTSEAMVTYATECFPAVDFFNIDAENIKKLNKKFSIITSFNCLHWIRDIRTVLSLFKN